MANDGSKKFPAGSSLPKKATVHLDPAKLALARANANRPAVLAPPGSPPPAPAASFKLQPAALPPGSLEAVMHALLLEHGARVYEDRRLFRSFMADGLGSRMSEHQLAVNTMVLLVEEGLPARMVATKPDNFPDLLQHEAARLARQHGIRPEVASEAVRCWAAALRPELAARPAPARLTVVPVEPAPSVAPTPTPRLPSTPIAPATAPASIIIPAPRAPAAQPAKLTPGRLALALLMLVILGASYWLGRTPPPAPAPPAPPPPLEVTRTNLTLRDGQLFRSAETNPFNGFLIERYSDGVMKSRSAISNGYLEGLSLGWYTNQQMQVQEPFVKSISHGLRTQWHPNGVKKSEAQIANGKLHGTFRRWDEQGKLAEEI